MVGIVSGNGVGLFNSSLDVLGLALGQAGFGQANGSSYVNLATGNLTVQFLDETLSGTGADLLALRTYNSLGAVTDGDQDGWRWNGEKKLVLTGTRNATGSTVKRTTGDGKETTFTWDGSKYITKDGAGAHDTLTWNSSTSEWEYREDGGSTVERYNGTTGWIKSLRDSSGNGFDYTFSGDKLTKVVDLRTGQTIDFVYGTTGTALNKVQHIKTRNTATGAQTLQVTYGYDTSNRLTSVTTDLTPDNTSDSSVYTTNYTYHGTSRRIDTVSQSDGTSVSYAYDASNRISQVQDQGGTTTFTYGTNSTTVQNGEGNVWTYTYDSSQRLTKVSATAVGGVTQSTTYSYDANGNVATIVDGKNKTTTFTYDANGNRTKEVDSLGNTVSRTFSSANLVTTETRYSVPSATTPGGAETVRYVYDSANRLRFTVSAEGRVSELKYTSQGQVAQSIQYTSGQYAVSGLAVTTTLSESQMTAWVSGLSTTQKSQVQVTEYAYDTRGNLAKKTDYAAATTAGAGSLTAAADVTLYTYTAHGQLAQTIVARGSDRTLAANQTTLTSMVYDGMGRVISTVNAGATTTTSYSGVTTTVSNTVTGLTVTTTTDSRGRVVSLNSSGSGTSRLTKYTYDNAGRLRMTEDPTGGRSYLFYDAAGRVAAKVDPTGAAVVYTYDANGKVLSETAHSNRANTSTWYNGTSVTVTSLTVGTTGTHIITDTAKDRKTTYTYDDAGRLSTTVVTGGLATVTNAYDGASRLVSTTQSSRVSRNYYDKDGRLIGTLDAEKGLVENVYDGAGRLIKTVRYGTPVTSITVTASTTFSALKSAAAAGSGGTLASFFYYDGEGRLVGTVNELGFLSETVYDAANNRRDTIQYMTAVAPSDSSTLSTLKTAAGSNKRTATTYFDIYGRVDRIVGHDSTQTRHIYDTAGRVVRTIQAQDTTEQRATRMQYNSFGEVTGVLSGEGDAHMVANPTVTLSTAITNYGTRYEYDGMGRKITELGTAAQTGSPQTKTFLFYNTAGQLTYTVNALGEVAKMTYNAFGQIESIRTYVNRVSSTNLPTITKGGAESLITGKLPTADNTNDVVIDTTYNQLGLVHTHIDGERFTTTNTYNTYGLLETTARTISTGVTTTSRMEYDLLGRVKETYQDHGGLAARNSVIYDGFGRIKDTIDANRVTTSTSYTDNGRTITVTGTQGRSSKTEIDAFGRTLKSYDSYSNVTAYAYDDVNRTTTVSTPEGVSLITTRTRTGETLQVQDSRGNITKYAYNKNGALTSVTDGNNDATTNTYYNNGLLYRTTDANNVITEFTYDAAGRVLTKVVDVGGLNLKTEYKFNGLGRQIEVVEGANVAAEAVKTKYDFDRNGQIKRITVDPDTGGKQLTTTFTYDGVGQTVKVEKGTLASPSQQVTVYVFDKLGRKTEERVDPAGLNLRTQYKYDANGNLTRVIDPTNNSTWFVYNSANQRTHTIDAMGGVTVAEYDKNGRVYHTRQYVTALASATVATFGNVITSVPALTTNASDRRTYSVYDRDGRLVYSISAKDPTVGSVQGTWVVSETRYDAAGNVRQLIAYAATLTEAQINTMTSTNVTDGALITPAELATFSNDNIGTARVTTYEYDGANRQTRTILPGWYDPTTGKVEAASATGRFQRTIEVVYDNVGNAVANKIRVGTGATDFVIQYKVYDKARREIFNVDALGYVTRKTYDAVGNLKNLTRYETALNTTTTPPNSSNGLFYSTLTAPSGNSRTTAYAYDKAGRQTSVTQANGGVTSYVYNDLGNVIQQTQKLTDSINADTFFYYDKAGRQVLTVDAMQHGTKTEYDAAGNIIRVTEFAAPNTGAITAATQPTFSTSNVKNRITEYTYDATGRVTLTKRALFDNITTLATVDTKTYNAFGEVRTSTDAQSNVTSVDYNRLGQMVKLTEPAREVAGTGVDVFKDKATDATPITEFTYDAFGQNITEVRKTLAGAGTTITINHVFDFGGNKIGTQDGRSNWTNNTYDVFGRVAKQTQTVAVTGTNADTNYDYTIERRFEYDKAGRQTAALDVFKVGTESQKSGRVNVYNGYGDVVEERKVWGAEATATTSLLSSANNNVLVATYSYKTNGELNYKRGTEGYVYYFFDFANRLTKTEQRTSTTANAATDRVTSYTYDKLGRVTELRLPQSSVTTAFDSTTTTLSTPIINRSYDRWGNLLSESGATTGRTLAYNQDNQVVQERSATAEMIRYNSTTTESSVTRKFNYDSLGRLLNETQEANTGANGGTVTASRTVVTNTFNNAGQLTRTVDATGIGQDFVYDIHGNRVGSRDALGHVTTFQYNANNQLIGQSLLRNGATGKYTGTETSTPTAITLATYSYDQAGRRYGEGDAAGNFQYYKFDERGNMLASRNLVGGVKLYEYDELGNLTAEKEKYTENGTTKTDVMRTSSYKNATDSDFVDFQYGLLQRQQIANSSALQYTYEYTARGELYLQKRNSTTVAVHLYWENGQKRRVTETNTSGSTTTNNVSEFHYDIKGNKTVERNTNSITTIASDSYGASYSTTNSTGNLYTYYAYDAQNRLTQAKSPSASLNLNGFNTSSTNISLISYNYDEWGNRRRIQATYGTATSPNKTEWYSYDAADRVLIEGGGASSAGAIVTNSSKEYAYDGAGRRSKEFVQQTTETHYGYGGTVLGTTTTRKDRIYTYNDLNLVATVQLQTVKTGYQNSTSTLSEESNTYDNRGYKTQMVEASRSRSTSYVYNLDGTVNNQETLVTTNNRKESKIVNVHNTRGDIASYEYFAYDINTSTNGQKYKNTYTYQYANLYTGRQITSIGATSTQPGTVAGATSNNYDANGRLVSASITEQHVTDSTKTGNGQRRFIYNTDGQVIAKSEQKFGETSTKVQTYYYSPDGGELANFGSFGQDISPLSAIFSGGNAPSSYTIKEGDTLMSIAAAVYGDSKLWYLIADANGLRQGPTESFAGSDVGRSLRLPNKDVGVRNTSRNWSPYSFGKISGSLMPSPALMTAAEIEAFRALQIAEAEKAHAREKEQAMDLLRVGSGFYVSLTPVYLPSGRFESQLHPRAADLWGAPEYPNLWGKNLWEQGEILDGYYRDMRAWEERVIPLVDRFILDGNTIETQVPRKGFDGLVTFVRYGIVAEKKRNDGGGGMSWFEEHNEGPPLSIGWSNDFSGGNSFYVNGWEVYDSNSGWLPNSSDESIDFDYDHNDFWPGGRPSEELVFRPLSAEQLQPLIDRVNLDVSATVPEINLSMVDFSYAMSERISFDDGSWNQPVNFEGYTSSIDSFDYESAPMSLYGGSGYSEYGPWADGYRYAPDTTNEPVLPEGPQYRNTTRGPRRIADNESVAYSLNVEAVVKDAVLTAAAYLTEPVAQTVDLLHAAGAFAANEISIAMGGNYFYDAEMISMTGRAGQYGMSSYETNKTAFVTPLNPLGGISVGASDFLYGAYYGDSGLMLDGAVNAAAGGLGLYGVGAAPGMVANVGALRAGALNTTNGTGAFLEGTQGGAGLGKLNGRQVAVSEKGLQRVETHLSQFGDVPENNLMLERLRTAMANGDKVTGADAIFYTHELSEYTMMARGLDYPSAHQAALSKYQVSPFSVYHPEVIQQINLIEPGSFNPKWLQFWRGQ